MTSSAFDRQNIKLLRVIPLSPFFETSTTISLGRLMIAMITAPPVLLGCLFNFHQIDFKTPLKLIFAIKLPGEAIFLTESLQIILIVLPNSTRLSI